jgi:hypothetical protein
MRIVEMMFLERTSHVKHKFKRQLVKCPYIANVFIYA